MSGRENIPNGQGITLSTVHGAASSLSRPGGPSASEFGDEANIAYVGLTRAIRELYLPQDLKGILTPEWQPRSNGISASLPQAGGYYGEGE